MSRALMGLLLVLAAGLILFPALAGEEPAVAVENAPGTTAEICQQAAAPMTFGLEELSFELADVLAWTVPCPPWTCTRPLQCGYECGGVSPSCSNPTGGICTGTCVCP